jgi:hypothetical protein
MGRIKPKTIRKRVEKSLRQQLVSKGADVEIFKNLIDDYMGLWDLKEMYFEDVKENGLRVDGKENTSPKQIPIVNRQMLAILKQMDITTDNVVREDGEENDAL